MFPLTRSFMFHETLRGDPWVALRFGRLGVMTLNQAISVVLIAFAVAAVLILYARGSFRPAGRRSLSASTPASPIGSE